MAFANTTTQSHAFFSGFSLARVGDAIGRGIHKMQVARMHSVLGQMSDLQLHQIGITRGEVADYADMLMLAEAKK